MKTRVALAGFMGSGKSHAAKALLPYGFFIFDGDTMAKELMQNSSEIKYALSQEYGSDILENGTLQFSILANRVFKSSSSFSKLNSIVHPFLKKHLTTVLSQQETPYIVDAAVLPLLHCEELFDCCIWLSADFSKRKERIIARTGLPEDNVIVRMKMQEEHLSVPTQGSWVNIVNNTQPESLYKELFCALGIVSGVAL